MPYPHIKSGATPRYWYLVPQKSSTTSDGSCYFYDGTNFPKGCIDLEVKTGLRTFSLSLRTTVMGVGQTDLPSAHIHIDSSNPTQSHVGLGLQLVSETVPLRHYWRRIDYTGSILRNDEAGASNPQEPSLLYCLIQWCNDTLRKVVPIPHSDASQRLAFLMSSHGRLGEYSTAKRLDVSLRRTICEYVQSSLTAGSFLPNLLTWNNILTNCCLIDNCEPLLLQLAQQFADLIGQENMWAKMTSAFL